MTYKSKNEYLETRCDFVLAKIAMIGDPDAEDTTYEALTEAQVLGHRDASVYVETGETIDCSPYFSDVRELMQEWIWGWNHYMELREMAECSGCNNERGDPCHIHG